MQRLNVSGDDQQNVSPLDALLVINEVNSSQYRAPGTGKLPDLVPPGPRPPYLDVTCDGYVVALDALMIINAINAKNYPAGWTLSANGGTAEGGGHVDSVDCNPQLHEGNSFLTSLDASLTIPAEASTLRVSYANLSFDTNSMHTIRDAFEVALVDDQGATLVHTVASAHDAFFNDTEGQLPQAGANTRPGSGMIDLDLAHIPAGTHAQLQIRLVNNDHDTETSVQITGYEFVAGSLGTPAGAAAVDNPSPSPGASIDFSAISDVSSSVTAQYAATSFEQAAHLLYADVALVNQGSYAVNLPLVAVVDHLSDPTVRLRNPDGVTPDGRPYLDFSRLAAHGTFQPGDVTQSRRLTFFNPNETQFTYDLEVLSQLNRSPVIAGEPVTQAFVGIPYRSPITASDPDGDPLTYSELVGPPNILNGNVIQWTPTASDKGTHPIVVRVSDGRGGVAEQSFNLTVTDTPPNRPPAFTSIPVVDANVGTPYPYQAIASDPDGNALTFSVVSGPTGLSINAASGAVTWTPTPAQLGNSVIQLKVEDGHGGTATQAYTISVQPALGNSPPTIISTAVTALPPGESYQYPVKALDGDKDTLTYSLTKAPPGMTIDAQSGVINWNGPNISASSFNAVADFSTATNPNGSWSYLVNDGAKTDLLIRANTGNSNLEGVHNGKTFPQDFPNVVFIGKNTTQSDLNIGGVVLPPTMLDIDPEALSGITRWTAAKSGTWSISGLFQGIDTNEHSHPVSIILNGSTVLLPATNVNSFGQQIPFSFPSLNLQKGDTIDFIVAGNGDPSSLSTGLAVNIVNAPGPSNGLTLTAAGAAAGFVLTNFARGFPTDSGQYNNQFGPVGPVGMVVDGDELIVSDIYGNVKRLPANRDGQDASAVPVGQSYGRNNAMGLARVGDRIYASREFANELIQINPDGTFNQQIVGGIPLALGIVANPKNGHLLVSTADVGTIVDVDPIAKTAVVLVSGVPRPDGLSISSDGNIVYAAATSAGGGGHILGFRTTDGVQVFDSGDIGGLAGSLDGTASGGGTLSDFIYANTNDGRIIQITLAANSSGGHNMTLLASGGTRGDFVTVDAKTGTLLITQSDNIVRLRPPLGATFGPSPTNGLKLTSEGAAAGFTLTEFAQGFPLDGRFGLAGPLGIVFPDALNNKQPYVIGFTGDLWRFPTDTDGQSIFSATVLNNLGVTNAVGLAQLNGKLYATLQFSARVVELNLDGTLGDIVASIGSATGIVANPLTGRLFVSGDNTIYDVDPIAHSVVPLVTGLNSPDGLALSPDGNTIYAAITGDQTLQGFDTRTGNRVFTSGAIRGLDGAAIGFGSISGFAFVNTNFGEVWRVNLNDGNDMVKIASGGSRGDFIAVDPNDGTLLLTQSTSVARLHPPAGANFLQDFKVTAQVDDGRGGVDTQNFTVRVAQGGNIQGTVFNDLDGDGQQGGSETGVSGFTLYLDLNSNGRPDAGEPTALSDANGKYVFSGVTPGSYSVREVGRAGWVPSGPAAGGNSVTVIAGQAVTVDFGNQQQATVVDRRPSITSTPPVAVTIGSIYTYMPAVSNPDGKALTFDLTVKPDGMAIDPALGTIVWTPNNDQLGKQNVILRVTDSRGYVSVQPIQITVSSPFVPPVITSEASKQAVVGLPYTYLVKANDPQAATLTYSLTTAPTGMQVDSNTGRITWTPTAGQVDTQHAVVKVSDSLGENASQAFDINVVFGAPNTVPVITSTPRTQVRLGSSYAYAVLASDLDGDPLNYALDDAPAGMMIDQDGMIIWTPTGAQFGANSVKVDVTDGRGGQALQSFTVNVLSAAENHVPSITSTATLAATVGRAYHYDVSATDADGDPIAFSLLKSPNGMSIDPVSGAMRWQPSAIQLGTYDVIVQAADTQGGTTKQSFNVTVRGANLPPVISSIPPAIAAVAFPYTYALKAIDPEGGPLAYQVTTGEGDMSIDSSGVVHYRPTSPGDTSVVLHVTDDQGASTDQAFIIVVVPDQPPTITSVPSFDATVGQLYTWHATAADPDNDPLVWALLEGPTGMKIDQVTGVLNWTPTAADIGTVVVGVVANDPAGAGATAAYALRVHDVDKPPAIASTPPTTAAAGQLYRYDIRATDPDNDPLTYGLATAPAGMTVDAQGRLTWPTSTADAGPQHIMLVVDDGRGGVVPQEFDLVIGPDTQAPTVELQIASNPVNLNESDAFQVTAIDNVGVTALKLTIGGVPVALDAHGQALFTPTTPGNLDVVATATDAAGNTGTKSVTVLVIDPHVTGSPTVDLTTPSDNATVTSLTDVIGTVQDDHLASWKLEAAPLAGGAFQQIASGTTAVNHAKLGTFDPTMLSNDSYILRLTAINTGGLSASVESTVNVSGNLKLGNFTLSFTDISIPVFGIPITLSRTYDTMQASNNGELGYGWRLEFRDVNLRTNLPSEDQFGGEFPAFRDGTRVFITLPGGQREGFTFRPKAVGLFDPYQRELDVGPETQSGSGLRTLYFVPSFVPDKGVTDTLSVRRVQLSKNGHSYFEFGGGLPYNPKDTVNFGGGYTVTTKEGTDYSIDPVTGTLSTVTDRNGNQLKFGDNDISSSSGPAITFARDLQGRIVSATDPAGKSVVYSYDDAGNLSAVRDRDGNTTQFVYRTSPAHYLDHVIDPLGRQGIQVAYSPDGRLSSVAGADGAATTTSYDPAHSSEIVTDALGNPTTLVYDERGNVITEADAAGGITNRTYDDNNNVLSESVVLGDGTKLTTERTYDDAGNVNTIKDPAGHITRNTYDDLGNLLTSTDPLGNTNTTKYDSHGNPIKSTDATGVTTEIAYDNSGRLRSLADAGAPVNLAYDNAGRISQRSEVGGQTIDYTYDDNGNKLTESTQVTTLAAKQTLVSGFVYDASGRIIQATDAEHNVTKTEYDVAGNRIALVDPLNRRTEFQYDSRGQLIATIFPDATPDDNSDNPRAKIEYDAAGHVTAQVDELGRRTEYVYDKVGRLITTIEPDATPTDNNDNPRVSIEYDAAGRVTARVDERGNRTEYEYDVAGNQTLVRTPLGHETHFSYDDDGRLIAVQDALGATTRYTYDAAGRRTSVIYADNSTSSTIYDANGRPEISTDALLRTTQQSYDAFGHVIVVTDALKQQTHYEYDELGRLVKQTDAAGQVTQYEYDGIGRRTATVLPLGQRFVTQYDAAGQVVSTTDANGAVIHYTYDQRGRLIESDPPGGESFVFTYDAAGERLTSVDARGTTHFAYDSRGHLLTQTDPDGSVVSYAYDPAGNRISLTTAAGTTSYIYDAENQLVTVTAPGSQVTQYIYNAAGALTDTSLPNGTTEKRSYDLLGRLTDVRTLVPGGAVAFGAHYALAANGRRDTVIEADGRRVDYRYDDLDRVLMESITNADHTTRSIQYIYDAVGNRKVMIDSANGQTDYSYDHNDRLLSTVTNGQTTAYTYDNNGNLLEVDGPAGKTVYSWNADDRIVAIDNNGDGTVDATYFYDADGNRVSVTSGGQNTRYLFDKAAPLSQLVLEYSPGGIIIASYTYGNQAISEHRGGVDHFYHSDGLGSMRALTDAAGAVTDRYVYDAFGRLLDRTGTSVNPLQFAGQFRDAATRLDYLRARDYDSETGRFFSRDSFGGDIRQPATRNLYIYGLDNPVNRTDPSGHFSLGDELATLLTNDLIRAAIPNIAFGIARIGVTIAAVEGIIRPASEARNRALERIAASPALSVLDDQAYRADTELVAVGYDVLAKGLKILDVAQTYSGYGFTLLGLGNTLLSSAFQVKGAPAAEELGKFAQGLARDTLSRYYRIPNLRTSAAFGERDFKAAQKFVESDVVGKFLATQIKEVNQSVLDQAYEFARFLYDQRFFYRAMVGLSKLLQMK